MDGHLLPLICSPCGSLMLLHVFPDWCNPWGLKRRSQWPWEFNEERWRERCHSISGLHSEVLQWPFRLLLNGPKQLYSNAKGTLSSGSHVVLLCWPLHNIGTPLAAAASTEDPNISETNKGDETITCGVSRVGTIAERGPMLTPNTFWNSSLKTHWHQMPLRWHLKFVSLTQSNNEFWAITVKDIEVNIVCPLLGLMVD